MPRSRNFGAKYLQNIVWPLLVKEPFLFTTLLCGVYQTWHVSQEKMKDTGSGCTALFSRMQVPQIQTMTRYRKGTGGFLGWALVIKS